MSSSPGARRSPTSLVGLLLLVAIIVVGGAVLVVSGAGARVVESLYPPIAVTEQGAKIRTLYDIVFLIAAAIFFLVEGLIVWTVVRYRRRPQDLELPPQTHGNAIAEIVWTVVPTIIVAFMFVLSWQTLNEVDAPVAQPDIKIRAVAGQFQWQFDYMPSDYDPKPGEAGPTPLFQQYVPVGPDGGLTVPTGRTVQLYLTSPDVIHAFYVPQFLFKRDVVPGRVNKFDFKVDDVQAGQTFRGQCAELCGAGHRVMLFEVHAMAGPAFDAWLAGKIAGAPPPPPASGPPASGQPSAPAESGAPPSGEPVAGTTLTVVAKNAVAFETPTLTAPANSPITIEFDNQDVLPHSVKIFKDSTGGPVVYDGEIFTGPAKKSYPVGPLAAGTYPFICAVHTNMTGTLTVE
jgi:cytochrome c oxidase subunit 2